MHLLCCQLALRHKEQYEYSAVARKTILWSYWMNEWMNLKVKLIHSQDTQCHKTTNTCPVNQNEHMRWIQLLVKIQTLFKINGRKKRKLQRTKLFRISLPMIAYAMFTTTIRFRFDGRSTGVRLLIKIKIRWSLISELRFRVTVTLIDGRNRIMASWHVVSEWISDIVS